MIDSPITTLPGIGAIKAQLFKEILGIESIYQLLYYRPLRYIDTSTLKKIGELSDGEFATISGTVTKIKANRYKKNFLEIELSDSTASLSLMFFGGVRYYKSLYNEGDELTVSGKISIKKKAVMVHPEIDRSDAEESVNTGRIIPVYPVPMSLREKSISTRFIRKIIFAALKDPENRFRDPLYESDKHFSYLEINDAVLKLHFPLELKDAEMARQRLAFNELFEMQLVIINEKQKFENKTINSKVNDYKDIIGAFKEHLPFSLTRDQDEVIGTIAAELGQGKMINRLIQGDVGSGKTVVSAFAAKVVVYQKRQVALMAPTAILAAQHYETFTALLPALKTALLTGATPKSEKEQIYSQLNDGTLEIVIGTHALIQDNVCFKDLGLAIIDEQHRFGLEQRSTLRHKSPDTSLIAMSATPIPRSLALTVYGDMAVSIIREKPAGRKAVKTMLFTETKKQAVYNSVRKYISQGRQVFFVVPLVEESEELELTSLEEMEKELKNVFPEFTISALHGQMKNEEKNIIMQKFAQGKSNILVSTTVIEVGIDVPNANVIVILHPERFGLAQLHQLRGRIGRGEHESFCVLLHDKNISEKSLERLHILEESDDGFYIAEKDLELRGAGELTGTIQSGFRNGFLFAEIFDDLHILEEARGKAEQFINNQDVSRLDELNYRSDFRRIIS